MTWALVVTQPNIERRVVDEFRYRDLFHRFFLKRFEGVQRGRLVSRLIPAFSRYIFVDPLERWGEILRINGVIDFVRGSDSVIDAEFNEQHLITNTRPFAEVPHSVIDGLEKRSVIELGDFILDGEENLSAAEIRFKEGDTVQIINKHSSMFGLNCRYQKTIGTQSIVMVSIFGRETPLTIAAADLEVVNRIDQKQSRRGGKRRHRRGSYIDLAPVI